MEFETPAAHVEDADLAGYVEYEIDVEKVLRQELPDVVDRAAIAPLTLEAIAALPERAKGAYVLFEDGRPVYAGKTDTRHGFRSRLAKHHRTIQDRQGLDPARIGFKAVRILVFSNFDVEAILIKAMREKDPKALIWNFSGFGSNDPGHNREAQEPAEFDKERPIDIDKPILSPLQGRLVSVLDLLISLKDQLPYTFRYETDARGTKSAYYTAGHVDQRDAAPIQLPDSPFSVRQAVQWILDVMPAGWQATVFPDRVILYRETTVYRHAREHLTAL
ncbi:MAG: GIY-YIG nuclease family protein [Pseudomonas balearica]|nr:GIY-YIG nuclease family protein [Stutzerimonas balearica]